MGKIFCAEFQRVPLKFHTTYLTHTLKGKIFYETEILRALRVKSSYAFLKCPPDSKDKNGLWCGAFIYSLWWLNPVPPLPTKTFTMLVPIFAKKGVFFSMGGAIIKMRQSWDDHLIFTMGIPILVRRRYIESRPLAAVFYIQFNTISYITPQWQTLKKN